MRIQEFDFSVDLLRNIIWQYDDAPTLNSLINQKSTWYLTNQTLFWTNWRHDVFDLRTANEFGLSVWSIILNLPLFDGPPPDPPDKPIWGFGPHHVNFDNGNFTNGTSPSTLPTELKRKLLQLRYFKLSSRADVVGVNEFLHYLFQKDGPIYVLDGCNDHGGMFIDLVYGFDIDIRLLNAIKKFDLIPRHAGVGINYRNGSKISWGFGPYNANFDNGNFTNII